MRHLLAILGLGLVASAQAQIVTINDTWYYRANPADYMSVPALGGGTVAGYHFIVGNNDGAGPVVKNFLNGSPQNSSFRLVLFRKVTSNAYGIYCDWNQDLWEPGHSSGLRLVEGEYIYVVEPGQRLDNDRSELLSGPYQYPPASNRHWQIEIGQGTFGTYPTGPATTVDGFKFKIAIDGFNFAVLDTVTFDRFNNVPFELYKQAGNGNYYPYSRIFPGVFNSAPGIVLENGNYVATAPVSVPNSARFAIMFAGKIIP